MNKVGILILFFFCVSKANAGDWNTISALNDGNSLLHRCQILLRMVDFPDDNYSNLEHLLAGSCAGTVSSVVGRLATESAFGGKALAKLCPKVGGHIFQYVRIVVKFLSDNPQMLNRREGWLARNAFVDAYPCEAKN